MKTKTLEVVILDFVSGEVYIHSVEIPEKLPNGQDTDEYIVKELDISNNEEYMIVENVLINDWR